jgi:LacI family transcriptional regulator
VDAPARGLASGVTHTLGLVVTQSAEQMAGDAFLGATLRGLPSVARAAGYRVVVEPVGPGEGSYAALLRGRQVDGVALSGPRVDDAELASLAADGFPVILHGSRPDLGVPSVDVDNTAGARLAVEHLLARGHRRIACVTFDLAYTAAQERLAGYRAALEAAGIAPDDTLVEVTGYRANSAAEAATRLIGRTAFSAVFAAADLIAAGVLGALRAAGLRVPEDVSLVGFDDIPLAEYLDPPLTTIRVPAAEVGEAVGQALLDRMAGRPVLARRLLPVTLVERGSVAEVQPAPRGGGRHRRS